jgi:CHAT domain-containing protein
MWWCPTGPFAFLPIHAAGIYDTEESECLSDYAISSYAPMLETLLADAPITIHPFKMLAVIQPEMQGRPGHSLPYTRKELETIQRHVPNEWLITLGTREAPTSVVKVLLELSNASLAHFACHGTQDSRNPLESALLLDDDKLTASMIIERRLSNASLAFLSACETAAGDERTPDEVVHLSATLLFAGFRGVVGTMW